MVLRLANLLHRSRSPEPLPPMRLKGGSVRVRLQIPTRWADRHPLSLLDLEEERGHLKALGFDFGTTR